MHRLEKFTNDLDKAVICDYIVYIKYIQMGGGGLTISISNSSGKPIYEQITIQIKSQIASGALAPGDALPSIRLLAALARQLIQNKEEARL